MADSPSRVQKINSYFAILIITMFGSGAALLIIHISTASTTFGNLSAGNAALEKSLLQ